MHKGPKSTLVFESEKFSYLLEGSRDMKDFGHVNIFCKKISYVLGSGTEGSDPGGGLVVEKLFPERKSVPRLVGGIPRFRVLGKDCFSTANISCLKVLRVFNKVKRV